MKADNAKLAWNILVAPRNNSAKDWKLQFGKFPIEARRHIQGRYPPGRQQGLHDRVDRVASLQESDQGILAMGYASLVPFLRILINLE